MDNEGHALCTHETTITLYASEGASTSQQASTVRSSIRAWIEQWSVRNQEDSSERRDEEGGLGDEREVLDDGEYDWEAEAHKPTRNKGFQRESRYPEDRIRFRRMLWTQSNGRWGGGWMWTRWIEEDVWERRIKDQGERVIRAWNTANIPQEVLLLVIECLAGHRRPNTVGDSYSIPRVEGLGNLALVCQAWYALIAPALFGRLEVTDDVVASPLRPSIAHHARMITVQSPHPIMTSARLSRSAPSPSPAVWLEWEGPYGEEDREAAPYHPSLAPIYSQLHRTYSNVKTLSLKRCTFVFSTDLLRLLASFSALERVVFYDISVTRVSEAVRVAQRGRSCTSLIRTIYVDEDCTPPCLPFVSNCWTRSYAPPNSHIPPFHGLFPAEQRLVAQISGLTEEPGYSTRYYLDPVNSDGETWVILICGQGLYAEFHTSHRTPPHPRVACIHRCLLRVRDSDHARVLSKRLAISGDAYSRLGSLRTVILETGSRVDITDAAYLIEALSKACGGSVTVLHRTSDEGLRVALRAKAGKSVSDAGLLSLFWCLRKHVQLWDDWLSESFRKSLSVEDRRGWDPSTPP